MEEPNKQNEYEKIFKPENDITIKILLNKPVRDMTLIIGKIVRVQAGENTYIHETGFLEHKRKKIHRKNILVKIFHFFCPSRYKIYKPANTKK